MSIYDATVKNEQNKRTTCEKVQKADFIHTRTILFFHISRSSVFILFFISFNCVLVGLTAKESSIYDFSNIIVS